MISVYTDGSSHAGGGKPGGWAYYLVHDRVPITCGYGSDPETTNNAMELKAALEGLNAAYLFRRLHPQEQVELVSDSEYVLGAASGTNRIKKNLHLATAVRSFAALLNAKTRWVPGHSGDTFNEACDRLAHNAKAEICKHCGPRTAVRKKKALCGNG